jgi:hypothetical protein
MNLPHLKQPRSLNFSGALKGFVTQWSHPLSAAIFTFVLYTAIAAFKGWAFQLSPHPYYNLLADAFLHGQLNLRIIPNEMLDLILYQGKYYLYWPPFPALLVLPLVAIFGAGFSDVLVNVVLTSVIAALIAAILAETDRQGLSPLSALQRGLLVIFFTFGTMIAPLVPFGKVWFTGQLTGLACAAFTYWAVLRFRGWKAFLLAGIGMACVFATRNSMILVGIWPAWFLIREHWDQRWWKLIRLTALAMIPILISVGLIGWYNDARFGNPLEIGYRFHQMNPFFKPLYDQYGAFNLHYLPTNLYYQFIFYPLPWRLGSPMGGSIFLLSPLFFAALWALWLDRRKVSTWVLAATFLVAYIPIGLLMGTGYFQYGPRYLLDISIPLLMLTAQGMRRWPLWSVVSLTTVSIFHYLIGIMVLIR